MQYALNEEGVRYHIDQADPDNKYFCPVCKGELIQRRGQKKIHHFAHKKEIACTDNWHYEEMTEWHSDWQERYPEECREVVVGNHRADILINGTVIEFQHSPMSEAVFEERSAFYTGEGYKLVWLFDGNWRMPSVPNSYVYVQQEDGRITGGVEPLTVDEFVEWSTAGTLGTIYDNLHMIRDVSGEDIYYGCQINKYATQDKCIQCPYRLDYGEDLVKCSARFKDYKHPVYLSGNDFVFFDDDGVQRMISVPFAPYPGKSIVELAIEYQKGVLGVRNLQSGYEFKVGGIMKQFHGRGSIKGFIQSNNGGYQNIRRDIYGFYKPDWVVKWFEG